jgi:hypothetical protein
MKYLRKIFENDENSQYEEILNIFDEYVDKEECEVTQEDNYISVFIDLSEFTSLATSLEELDSIKSEYLDRIKFIESIKIALKRMEFHNYIWSIKIEDYGIYIRIQKAGKQLTIEDAFKDKRCDEAILKKVAKDVYNLNFSSYRYEKGSSGYYGKNPEMLVYFREVLENDHQIIKDIKKIFGEYYVSLVKWETSSMIKIKIS